MAIEEIKNERLKKLGELKAKGIDPYPSEVSRTHNILEAKKKFAALESLRQTISLAGRIMAKREHGGSTFFDLFDGTGKMQVYFKEDVLGEAHELAGRTLDIGDFISAEGNLFKTKKGEETLEAKSWSMLAKALLPLPEKWHGLQDVEERFRKRYLDLLMNEKVRRRFEARSSIIGLIREFHEKNGFLEVETPMLHPIPGGALAKPFVTRHNALDIDLYLRIAPELYLKRLLVGGIERVFEIGKCFRNEGIDLSHNPEFTMLESYSAYWNEEQMIFFTENLFDSLAKSLFGKDRVFQFAEKNITMKAPFARIKFKDLLARYAQITDYGHETRDSMATRARQLGIETESRDSKGKIADEIYKKICRPHLIQPAFVTNHPLEISPLAKKSENPEEVRRFQLIAAGIELTNGFSVLNDSLDQRRRFEEQESMLGGGEEEAHRLDEEYIEAMEYGMPPAAGIGIGIDRLVMLFTDTKNIREAILFPTLRPKKEE